MSASQASRLEQSATLASDAEGEKQAKAARAKAQADTAKAKRERLAKRKAAAAARKREQAAKAKHEKAVAAEAKYEKDKGDKLEAYLSKLGLKAQGMSVAFNDGTATVRGTAANRAAKEKIALALGLVEGVKKVNDMLKVKPAPGRAAKKLTPAQRKAATARRLGTTSAKVETGVEAFGTKTSFADFLGVAKTQPGRWLAGKETPRPQTARLVKDVDYLWDRLRTDLSEEAARIWLNSPNPFLNGATPFTWLKQHGPGQVIAAFDAAEAGSYP